ncbi:MAG: hypothetical protein RL758_1652 [Pseudomonadota bacterium]|jgi:small Trp-rich protein
MYLLAISVLLSALKFFEVGPFTNLGWTWIIALYALTAVWWFWADWSGYTARDAQSKMDKRKKDRIQRQRDMLGAPKRTRK